MPRFKNVNGVVIQLTAEEETIRDAQEAQAIIDKQTQEDADAQKATDRAAGNQKLLDLGLTQNEINAITN